MILMRIAIPLTDRVRYLNMALLVDALVEPAKVTLKFAAPSPASVGASDWSVEPYEVTLRGADADVAARWLNFNVAPSDPALVDGRFDDVDIRLAMPTIDELNAMSEPDDPDRKGGPL